jgi:hypothetical protein
MSMQGATMGQAYYWPGVAASNESRALERPTVCYRGIFRKTANGGEFNRSMQHTMIRRGGRSVADESTAANVLHRHSEGIDVGALEVLAGRSTRLAISLIDRTLLSITFYRERVAFGHRSDAVPKPPCR